MTRIPRIGLSSCFLHPDDDRMVFKGKTLLYVEQSMLNWVATGGALVYLVPPPTPGGPPASATLADLDGLVLHGGSDVAPESYGEEPIDPRWPGDPIRDAYEIDLVHRFLDASKPVLGICRGAQVLNVALGGTLYQDLLTQEATTHEHRSQELYDENNHDIDVSVGSSLESLLGPGRHRVNSIHHQAIKDLAPGCIVEAVSSVDGVIEAIRLDQPDRYARAVQWHPEFFDSVAIPLADCAPLRTEFLTMAKLQGSP